MADMSQSQARAAAIAAGHSAEEVDAFIAKEGGARTSAQRITSAFGVAGSTGTNDLSGFHAQKATAAGADASGKGTYLSGGGAAPFMGGPTTQPVGGQTPGSMTGLDTVLNPAGASASATPSVQALGAGEGDDVAGLISSGSGSLRSLGQRIPAQNSMALAGLGRRVY